MKLKRLFFIALLCIVGMSSAWAQQAWTDKTSLITNPSFEIDNATADLTSCGWATNRVTGWTIFPASAKNSQVGVGNSTSKLHGGAGESSSATNGEKFFYTRNNWNADVNFGIEQTIASNNLPAGIYMMTCKIKAASSAPDKTKWTISLQESGKVAVTNTNPGSAAEWLNCGVIINKLSDETTLTIKMNMLPGSSGNEQHYVMMIDDVQLKYLSETDIDNLSEENTLDVSGVIYNAGIYNANNANMPRGWTAYKNTRGNNKYTEDTGDTRLEGWSGGKLDIDYYQQIKGLPAGKYRMTATCHDSNDRGAYAYIYNAATSVKQTVDMSSTVTNITTPYIIVGEGDAVNIGIAGDNLTNGSWVTGDNFRLEFLGTIKINYNILKGTVKKATTINAVLNNSELATTLVNAQNIINNASAEDQESVNALVNTINGMLPTTTLTETFDGDISSWSVVTEGTTYNGTKAYGSNEIINGATPPATDIYGNSEGKVAFSSAGWGSYSYYSKTINNLPAGKYIVYYEAYNASNTTVIGENKTGLGTDFSTMTTGFTENEWTTDAVAMTVHNTGNVTISAGMRSIANTGSGSVAKLWFDNVTLYCVSTDKVVETPALVAGNEWYFRAQNGKYINASGSVGNGDVSFKVINTDLNETLLQKHNTDNYLFFNDENGLSAGNYATYTDGTVPPAKATHGLYWLVAAQNGGYTLYNLLYNKYLVVDANGNLTKGDAPYVWMLVDEEAHSMVPGADLTGKITNNSFEEGNTNGWTVDASTDTGVRENSNAKYSALGCDGNYLFNTWSDGKALTQNIGTLAAGIYRLSAMLATGDNQDLEGTVKLTLNDGSTTTESAMVSRHGNKTIMHERSITFVSDGTKTYTIGAIGGDTGNGGHWWYKADNFRLTYVNTTDKLFEEFTAVKNACTPWTSGDAYATTCAGYRDYTSSTAAATLLAAINYMQENFDTYAWDNASEAHPYDMTALVLGRAAACNYHDNTIWAGNGRSTKTSDTHHWSGDDSRVVFRQNHEEGPARSQSFVIPFVGTYKLRTTVRTMNAASYAEITVGEESKKTTGDHGSIGGDVNMDGSEGTDNLANSGKGHGWYWNDVKFNSDDDNVTKTISINLSNENIGHPAEVGGMFLYYIGDKFEYVKNKVHYYHGAWGETDAELTETVPVLDVTKATGSFNVNAANPNGLVYTNGATINGVTNNIVSNGTCANLVLVDGNNFHAHESFEATNARYTMSSIAVKPNGNKFGTLMIPFAAANKPDGCKIYNLDQDMNLAAEILATSTGAIAANKPVLVTESGAYTASSVNIAATTADTYSNGHLTGTYTATTASEGTYVLQKHDYTDPEDNTWTIAFFLVGNNTETPIKPTVKPFHAYINKLGNNNVKAINIVFEDDVETAIESAPASQERETVIYDLSGRRVQNVQRGIYIINGKKILK